MTDLRAMKANSEQMDQMLAMREVELRMFALQIAANSDDVIVYAKKYLAFVKGEAE